MSEVCSICGGSGLRVVQEDGRQFAQECVCRVERRASRMLERAHIPRRYEHCSLESYETNFPSSNRTLAAAHLRARKFVEGYPLETAGTGLLLTGSIGVGKTHLAVGILQASGDGARRNRALLRLSRPAEAGAEQLQRPGSRDGAGGVAAGLRGRGAGARRAGRLEADRLGVGYGRPYSEHALQRPPHDDHHDQLCERRAAGDGAGSRGSARESVREETLGDRIGERMRSRLQEMCVVVEMQGEDFRQKVKRASFA